MKILKTLLAAFIVSLLIASLLKVNSKANQSPPSRYVASSTHTQESRKYDYLVGYSCGGKSIKRAIITTNASVGLSESNIYKIEKQLVGNFCKDPRIFTFQKLAN